MDLSNIKAVAFDAFGTRWEQQMATDYSMLGDDEKESDREQVRLYLPVIADALAD
jgi:hypothetical protein